MGIRYNWTTCPRRKRSINRLSPQSRPVGLVSISVTGECDTESPGNWNSYELESIEAAYVGTNVMNHPVYGEFPFQAATGS